MEGSPVKSVVTAVIAAGGVGSRLKSHMHKPFVRLHGRPLLAWTLSAFERSPEIDAIVVVIHPADMKAAWRMIQSCRFKKVVAVVPGGESRMASVFHGLQAVPDCSRWVAVHDGARSLITPALIRATCAAARRFKAAIAAVPVVPTIKQAADGWVTGTLDRDRLWAVQTPQVFQRDLLERAHAYGRKHRLTATDDAALVEKIGHKVRIVMGDHRNIKITTPEDLVIAKALLRTNANRNGV